MRGEEPSEGGNAPQDGREQRRGWRHGQCEDLTHPSLGLVTSRLEEGYSELGSGREPRGLDLRWGLGEQRDQAPQTGGGSWHRVGRGRRWEGACSVVPGRVVALSGRGQSPPALRCLSSGSWPCPLEPEAGVSCLVKKQDAATPSLDPCVRETQPAGPPPTLGERDQQQPSPAPPSTCSAVTMPAQGPQPPLPSRPLLDSCTPCAWPGCCSGGCVGCPLTSTPSRGAHVAGDLLRHRTP